MPPTLRDVAREAGLAVSTVSLALRNRGSICDETRTRVRSIAARMGYRANPLLASLAARRFRRSSTAGLTPIVWLTHATLDYSSMQVEPGVMQRAAEMGYRLQMIDLARHRDPAALGRQLYHRGVVGVALGILYGLQELPDFPWDLFAVVSRGRQWFPTPFPVARYEIFGDLLALWERLRARGYRRIGWAVMRHEPEHPDDRERQAAAFYCVEHSPARDRIPLLRCPMIAGQGDTHREELAAWVKQHRPDCVVGFHVGLKYELQDLGYRIPGELGFASLHLDTDKPGHECAGLDGDDLALQLRTIELLDLQIRANARGIQPRPAQMIVPARWVEGPTVRPPAAAVRAESNHGFWYLQPSRRR